MKKLLALSFTLVVFLSALQCQTESTESLLTSDNQEYLEWASKNAFKFMAEVKMGETTLEGLEILDKDGHSMTAKVHANEFNLLDYDFNQVICPEKNIMIKLSGNKALFVYSKHRQKVLFERYLASKE